MLSSESVKLNFLAVPAQNASAPQAQTVRDSFSSYKVVVRTSLNPEVIAILLDGEDFAYWWSFIGKGVEALLSPAPNYTCLLLLYK